MYNMNATKIEMFDCLKDCIQARDVSNPAFKLSGSDLNTLYSVIESVKDGGQHKEDIRCLLENHATHIYGQFILWIYENRFLKTEELINEFQVIENEIVKQINELK